MAAPIVDPQILSELHGNVILIKPEAFIQNLMYGRAEFPTAGVTGTAVSLPNDERRSRDEKLAEDCLAALATRNKSKEFNNVVQSLAMDESQSTKDVVEGVSPYTSNKFTKLFKGIKAEEDLYRPLAALFAFIGHFYRCYFNESSENEVWSMEIDKSWPRAVHPMRPNSKPRPPALRRGFLISYDKPFRFSPHVQVPPGLQPDISLVLFKKAKKAKLPSPAKIHWKDVKVPITVKLRDGFDANRVCQMARYVRVIKMEQFDRNFIFSILISKTKCRVFYWDASQIYVTEIDMHKEPTMFIQVIGRLASMDPQSMGYDARFSNSGRVLASETQTIATKLEVVSAAPTQFHDQHSKSEAHSTIDIDLYAGRPLFQAPGLLFSHFTRVWEGPEVVGADGESGNLRVVKQNWANTKRVNEAFFYEKTREVPNVVRLVGSEARCHTIDASTWSDGDVMGVYRADQWKAELVPHLNLATDEIPFTIYKCDSHPQTFSRVLVRMVFEEKGRSNLEVRDSRELLEAMKQWLTGLWGLKEKGILHRDVSSGNLLLGRDADSPAFIIDLGLAQWEDQHEDNFSNHQSKEERVAKAQPQVIGTLPFVALQLLSAKIASVTLKHKSIMTSNRFSGALLSTDVGRVHARKTAFFAVDLNPDYDYRLELDGRFKVLAHVLGRFATMIWDRSRNKGTIDAKDIVDIIDTEISSLPHGSGMKVKPAGYGGSKRKLQLAEGQEERVDENRPGQSSRMLRTTRSSSRLVRPRVGK
ncbi:hypothetical protein FS837_000398 [Tulasnella sp. UAMH 9824]|nr:hypothetical protein FS837_000398 [Tulasnella sp. UAMH 9824]